MVLIYPELGSEVDLRILIYCLGSRTKTQTTGFHSCSTSTKTLSRRAMAAVREDEFPAPSKQATGTVNGIETQVTSLGFSDKLLVTISQEGRLSQWVRWACAKKPAKLPEANKRRKIQVPLTESSAGAVAMTLPTSSHGLLPSTHLSPTTLLGGGGDDRETLGHLYAAQIASHISLKSPDDRRTLVLGLGLVKFENEREAFFDLFELAQKVL